jgi:hypothetical protein
MAPLPASKIVLDGEGDAPTVRGRGKPLENGERNAIYIEVLSIALRLSATVKKKFSPFLF